MVPPTFAYRKDQLCQEDHLSSLGCCCIWWPQALFVAISQDVGKSPECPQENMMDPDLARTCHKNVHFHVIPFSYSQWSIIVGLSWLTSPFRSLVQKIMSKSLQKTLQYLQLQLQFLLKSHSDSSCFMLLNGPFWCLGAPGCPGASVAGLGPVLLRGLGVGLGLTVAETLEKRFRPYKTKT